MIGDNYFSPLATIKITGGFSYWSRLQAAEFAAGERSGLQPGPMVAWPNLANIKLRLLLVSA